MIDGSQFGRHRHLTRRHRRRAGAAESLRGVLCFCNSPLMNQVEADIQFKPGLISADGDVTDEGTKKFLQNYMNELHAFIVRVLTVLPRKS